mmetsp:Transcript_15099/g.41991  ORF Transcript_15099/g.41991 Transcript_15099/m.41991 type:complete len:363 (+) Transcript_15099:176-1264(+)
MRHGYRVVGMCACSLCFRFCSFLLVLFVCSSATNHLGRLSHRHAVRTVPNRSFRTSVRDRLESSNGIEHDSGRQGTNSENNDSNSGNNSTSLFVGGFDIDECLADIIFGAGGLALGDAVDPSTGSDRVVEVGVLSSVNALGGEGSPGLVRSNYLEFLRSGLAALDGESLGGSLRAGGPGELDLVVGDDLDIEATPGEFLCLGVHQEGSGNTGLLVFALAAGLGLLLHDGLDLGFLFGSDGHPRSVLDTVGVSQVGGALHLGDLDLGQFLDLFLEAHAVNVNVNVDVLVDGGSGGGSRSGLGSIGGRFLRREKGSVHVEGNIHARLLDSSQRLSSGSESGGSLYEKCNSEKLVHLYFYCFRYE